jgi:hypothetical protein
MSAESTASYCHECKGPLTEIDNRGQILKGLHDLQYLVVGQWRQSSALRGGPLLGIIPLSPNRKYRDN